MGDGEGGRRSERRLRRINVQRILSETVCRSRRWERTRCVGARVGVPAYAWNCAGGRDLGRRQVNTPLTSGSATPRVTSNIYRLPIRRAETCGRNRRYSFCGTLNNTLPPFLRPGCSATVSSTGRIVTIRIHGIVQMNLA